VRLRDRVTIVVSAVALCAAVLAVGGALRWTAALVTILVALALVPMVASRRGLQSASPLVVGLGAAAVLTALQLLPLPDGLLMSVDPVGHMLRNDGAELADVNVWPAITLDVPGSLRALTFFITLLGVAVVALRIAANEKGRFLCLGAVSALCGATALIVGIHQIFDASSLYGIYEPIQATPPVLGPLLNANHLGCLMALGAVVSVGLLVYPKQSTAARVVWGLSALGCMVVVLASLSRGAVLALASGLGVTLGTVLAQRLAKPTDRFARSRRRKFIMNTLPIATVSVCVLIVIVMTTAGTAAEQLQNTSLQEIHEPKSKYAAWRSSVNLIEEAPWVGVGRGALEPAFTRVHPASAFVTFSHLENEYVQAVVEWGIPGAIVLAIPLAWLGLLAIRRWRDGPLAAASLGGLAVVAIQSNVDFGVELLGLAVPATVVAATAAYVPLRTLHDGALTRARAMRLGHLVVLAAAAILLGLPITRTVAEDHIALDNQPTMAEIREVIERHPLDYYAYAVAAETMVKDKDPTAIGMLNYALALHPTHPGLHLFAGRLLLATHYPEQAALEYAAALRATPNPTSMLDEIAKGFSGDIAPDAIPLDYENIDIITRTLSDTGHADLALAWIARVQVQKPRSPEVTEAMFALATRKLPELRTPNDWEVAERAARAKLELMPSPRATLDLAKILSHRNAHRDVIRMLIDVERWHGRIDDQVEAWLLLCDSYIALENLDEAERCLHRLDGQGLVQPGQHDEITKRLVIVQKGRLPTDLPAQRWNWRFGLDPSGGSGSAAPKHDE
jgi:O-antigen ligase